MNTRNPHPGNVPSIVYTNPARCRDCCRCVRICPVKAIRYENGQASVDPERCVQCGSCIRECPQGAKAYRNDVERVKRLLAEEVPAAVSVAPSFAGFFHDWEWARLPSALRLLGFDVVEETAVGAWHSARRTAEWTAAHPGRPWIESSCPAVVSYVEKYAPGFVASLTPVLSPMAAHASLLRRRLQSGARVVFIGPCVAKKAEAERPGHAGLVDAVLTFEELGEWLGEAGIDLSRLEESGFDAQPAGEARCYPLLGGCMQTAEPAAGPLSPETVAASGPDALRAALGRKHAPELRLIECLFCVEGCIGGPAGLHEGNFFDKRDQVLRYARERRDAAPTEAVETPLDLHVRFEARPPRGGTPIAEEAIRRELAKTGKADPENQLNCGACGYGSCRDQAEAVLRGMAESGMCLPHMRRRAECRTDRIMETSPNGIAILDERLHLLAVNPAFKRLFACSEAILGEHVGRLMDPDSFERLLTNGETQREEIVEHAQYNRTCRQIIYRLAEENQIVAIFVNVTESRRRQEELETLRRSAMDQARELLDHQLQAAQTMTRFLGENAARGEALLEQLVDLVGEGSRPDGPGSASNRT